MRAQRCPLRPREDERKEERLWVEQVPRPAREQDAPGQVKTG